MENFLETIEGLWQTYMGLPWWGMLIVGLAGSAIVNQAWKVGKNVYTAGSNAVRTTVGIVSLPFRGVRWVARLVIPEDINAKYKNAKSLTISDLLALNHHFAKHGTDKVDSDLLVLFTESLEGLRDARGKQVRVKDIASYYGKGNALNGEISRTVLELSSRGDSRAQDIIQRVNDSGQIG